MNDLSSGSGRPRVLIVEDEHIVAADLEATLAELGYDVVCTAERAERAVEQIEASRPDIVLMDIKLKGSMDGIAAADEIRRLTSIPVVFLTANADDETLSRARATDPYGYVIKPFRPRDLHATLRVALNQHRLVTELFSEHAWLQEVLGTLSDGVIATDATGIVRYTNPAADRLLRLSHSEALGQTVEDIYSLSHLDSGPVRNCQIRRALASANSVPQARFLLHARRESRPPIPIENAAVPIFRTDQLVGAVAVFVDITDQLRREREQEAERDRLEEKMIEAAEALGNTRAELRALSGHLLTMQEEEHRRIARELHDDFAQRAALIEMELDRLAGLSCPTARAEALAAARKHVIKLSESLRTVSHRLHPSTIIDLGLPAALRQLVREFNDAGGDAAFIQRGGDSRLNTEVSTTLFRITQEALRNVMKHAGGGPVRIVLDADHDIHLSIQDAGPGFNLEAARSRHGLGLLSMHERARLAGGTLSIQSELGEGTLISVHIREKMP